jgi:hypothetical protein
MEFTVEFKVPNTPLFNGTAKAVSAQETRVAMEGSVLMLQGAIQPITPVNMGVLRGGVQTSIGGTPVNLVGRVFDNVPYAMAVEHGRKPGKQPPTQSLMLWVRRKLGISDEKQARSVAFLVARKIGQRGTKGAFMFRRGLQATTTRINARFSQARDRIVQRLGGA